MGKLKRFAHFLKPDVYDVSLLLGIESGYNFAAGFNPLETAVSTPIIYLVEKIGEEFTPYIS